MRLIRLIIAVTCILLGAIVGALNTQPVLLASPACAPAWG